MRIGVNVPNEIIERFKPLKGTYNLSQICREAIASRIEAYERSLNQGDSDDMQAAANKLWLEYSAKTPVVDWETIGRDDAKVWVQLAAWEEDFENLFHNVAIRKKKGGDLGAFLLYRAIPGTKRFEDHYEEHKTWFSRQMELNEKVDPHTWAKTEYYRGWFSYVTAVWQMVKDKIAANATATEKRFEETRQKSLAEGLKDGKVRAEILAEQ